MYVAVAHPAPMKEKGQDVSMAAAFEGPESPHAPDEPDGGAVSAVAGPVPAMVAAPWQGLKHPSGTQPSAGRLSRVD